MMNQCIHGVDLLRWMMGDDVVEVYAQTAQQFHHYLECEDVGMAVVKFANGAIGIGEITSIPTAPAIADAYYRYDGKFRTSLPLEGTPYSRK